jgi:hypothetical protein
MIDDGENLLVTWVTSLENAFDCERYEVFHIPTLLMMAAGF